MHWLHIDVHHFIQQFGYEGVFLILMIEMVGIPFPAETTLTVSGIEWWQGTFHLLPLVIVATLGNIVGSSVAYGIGRYLGRPVILWLGKYVGITREKLDRAEARFQKSERLIVVVAKFVAGIRVLVPYLAGINKMSFVAFSFFNAISAILWVLFFVVVGRYIGVAWRRYHQVLHHSVLLTAVLVVVVLALYVAFRVWKRKRHSPPQE